MCTLRRASTEFGSASPAEPTPRDVHQLATGAVGVFRGLLWRGPDFPAIFRRSPQAPAGRARLVVAIDPVDKRGAR